MARDVSKLRQEASEAYSAGKYKRALAAYLELERLEPREAQWSKRAAETYRRLGKDKDAIQAYARAVERYAQGGFLVQAIAVCKLILQIDPKNNDALMRLASMNEQIGAGPSRAMAMLEHNPNLADHEKVQVLRAGRGSGLHAAVPDDRRSATDTNAPPVAVSRTRTPQNIAIPRKVTPEQLAIPRKTTPVNMANVIPPSAQDALR